jgi:hypothetical protein
MATIAAGPSREQAMRALAVANDVRITNAVTLREIGKLRKADSLRAGAELLRHGLDGPLGAVSVGRFVGSVRGIGTIQTDGLLAKAGVVGDRSLRRLSTRQVHVLAEALDDAAAHCQYRYRTVYR